LKDSAVSTARVGVIYALLAYSAWGIVPLYWKLFGQIPALEILSHRVVWSMLFLTLLLLLQQRGTELKELLRSPKILGLLLITSTLVCFNWGVFIYSITVNRVIESSLGYYINPLMNVLLGAIFLRERLKRGQQIAVGLATVGVTYFIAQLGQVPWIALGLALTFSLYGLLRKLIPVNPLVGLTIETAFVTPIALLFIAHLQSNGTGHLGANVGLTALMMGCGIVTSFPLLWFNHAAKRLRLTTLGFFQYIAPSLQLLLGVFLFGEAFTTTHIVTFTLIWAALMVYSISSRMVRPVQNGSSPYPPSSPESQ
jgi:chloramphenicol-sensitive protein RarD